MQLNIDEIIKILPHRYPMLLVDRVEELEPFEYAKGYKAVTFNEPYFQAHFPGNPIMPGVIIMESVAQLAHIMVVSKAEYQGKLTYWAKISKAKFYDTVKPGTILTLIAKKKGFADNLVLSEVKVLVGDKPIFTAEITTMIVN